MAEEKKIRELAESLLTDKTHFLVAVEISTTGGRGRKVRILMDGDEGISIDDCVALSRALGEQIEEKGLMDDDAYTLEVSSPGLDHPLESVRQYRKNIGRGLKVIRIDGKEVRGTLSVVRGNSIVLESKKGKGKKAEMVKEEIPLAEIKKSLVQISFK